MSFCHHHSIFEYFRLVLNDDGGGYVDCNGYNGHDVVLCVSHPFGWFIECFFAHCGAKLLKKWQKANS